MTPDIHLIYYIPGEQALDIPLYNNSKFTVDKAENLRWGSAEIAANTNPYKDGDIIQNVRGLPRDIEFTIKPTADKGDYNTAYESLARFLGKSVTLEWRNRSTANGTKLVTIKGTVTECTAPISEQDTRFTLTIHCPEPYWEEHGYTTKTNVTSETIKGSAPPYIYSVSLNSVLIPSGAGYLYVGGWKFTGNENLLGNVIITPHGQTKIKVDGVSHPETLTGALSERKTDVVFTCHVYNPDSPDPGNNISFSITYIPRYY